MKVALSEKQLKLITSMVEVDGDTSASSGADTASTTSTASSSQSSGAQSSKAGYPAVDKWESGITRGPANPIGVAKWADVVGAKLTRGHANPLKEQTGMPGGNGGMLAAQYANGEFDTPTIEYTTPWLDKILIPKDSYNVVLYKENELRVRNWGYEKDEKGNFKKDAYGNFLLMGQVAPTESELRELLPTGTLRQFTTKKDNEKWYVTLKFNEEEGPNKYRWFVQPAYFGRNSGKQYDQSEYVNVSFNTKARNWFSEHWVDIAIVLGAAIAGALTGGAAFLVYGAEVAGAEAFSVLGWSLTNRALAAYAGEALVWTASATWKFTEGKYGESAIDAFFGFILPGLHGIGISRWGIKVTDEVIGSTASKVFGKTAAEIDLLMYKPIAEGGFNQAEKEFVKNVAKLPKESINGMTKELIAKADAKIAAKGGANSMKESTKQVFAKVAEKLETSKVGAFVRKKWYTYLPVVLAHDMIFIHLVHDIATKFGIVDKGTVDMLANKYNEAKTDIEKKKVADETRVILEKSGKLKEFEDNFMGRVSKIDSSGAQYDKSLDRVKWKGDTDPSRGVDSLINVYKQ
jgi:hypothetical protein